MKVPFLDLKAAYLELKDEIDAAVARVLNSGWYILGEEVEAFEAEWAEYCGARYCVGVGNGLDAITLSLRALGIEAGDEVIVPSNTYIATWLAVTAVGARIIPVEPDPVTYTIDPTRIAEAITPATKAILPVHLYGQPADLDPILALARKYSLAVIEDAAQAHGARYKGQRIGAHGDVVKECIYPGKNLGAMGDAGAITTNRQDIAERVKLLRNYGSRVKYVNELQGVNSRLDPLQAAILRVKLQYLDPWNARRQELAMGYLDSLKETNIILPEVAPWAEHVWHLFVIRSHERDQIQHHLTESNIGTLIHYPIPPHRQQAYASKWPDNFKLPIAEQLATEVLSLPIGPHLRVEGQAIVCKTLKCYTT